MLVQTLFLAIALSASQPKLGKKSLKQAAPKLSAAQWLTIADEYRAPSGTISFQVAVTDLLKSKVLRKNTYRVYSKDGTQILVETLAPKRLSGRKLLMASTLWMYLPTLKKPTQVSLQSRLTGEVSNGDIARMQFSRDYDAKIISQNHAQRKLWLIAKSKTATYRHIRLVTTADGLPTKAEFFALSGRLLKSSEYAGLSEVLGSKRLTRVIIRDAIDPNKQSHLVYSNYRTEVLDDVFFDKENLVD